MSASYDPWGFVSAGPAWARELLHPQAAHYPPAVALPNGAYSYCFDCRTNLAPGQRCPEPAQLSKLRSAGVDELLSVACCPLDLADEIAARRRRYAVAIPLPQRESKPRRWWRRKEK